MGKIIASECGKIYLTYSAIALHVLCVLQRLARQQYDTVGCRYTPGIHIFKISQVIYVRLSLSGYLEIFDFVLYEKSYFSSWNWVNYHSVTSRMESGELLDKLDVGFTNLS